MAKALTIEEKVAKSEGRLERMREEQASGVVPTRKKRGVFNGTEVKLKVGKDIPGYHLHIMNDTPGRIQEALDGGYEFCTPDEVGGVVERVTSTNTDVSDRVRYLVGTDASGGPMYAYLMKIRQEWYEEDQDDLQERNNKIDAAIRSGQNTKDGTSSEGFYTPKGTKIQYKT